MTQKVIAFAVSTITAFVMSGGVAFAQSPASDNGPKDAPSASTKAALQQAANGSCDQGCMSLIKAYGKQLIDNRLTDLTDRDVRIQAMTRLSASQKASLSASIQTNVSAMNTLRSKIDADTDVTILMTDVRSITKDYRIYLLIMPQLRAAAATYRVQAVYDSNLTLAAQLQTRIDHATSTSVKAQAQAALDDMKAKTADAKTQTDAALALIINLTPDKGDQVKQDSNKAAVTDAKNKLTVANADISAAKNDVATIRNLLKP